ncbi:MAG: glycosyltransferase family 1 protein [bacterium]|nr:glycosyltransferase family 1 protein [bacterium]
MKKIRVAIMADDFDLRPERTLFFRRLIEHLIAEDDIELTLIHSKPMPDEPLYKKAREILLPQIPLPYATRFLAFIRFCITTKEQFDIVHWLKPRLFPFFWLFPARRTLVMMHGGGDVLTPGIWTFSRRVFNYTLMWFHKYVDAMIAVSEYANKEIIYAYHTAPEKVRTIYNGLDPMYEFIPDDKTVSRTIDQYGIKSNTYFLYLGRPELHKNVGSLVSAYLRYREHNPKRKELLVLGGSAREKYERSFGVLPTSPFISDIRFLGYIPTEDLPALYRGAIALAFISINEGFGVPLIEAMACGTPVITSSVTSLPEVAGNAAIIVSPLDIDAIAEALLLVCEAPVRATLIKRGFARAKFFAMKRTLDNTVTLYRELAGVKKPFEFNLGQGYSNSTNLKTPLPEAIDKLSILLLKRERCDKKDLPIVEKEYAFFRKVVDSYRDDDGIDIKQEWIDDLKKNNATAWDMEADIRQGRENGLGLEEVGRRAIILRDVNKVRMELKKRIADEAGLDFYEIKTETT